MAIKHVAIALSALVVLANPANSKVSAKKKDPNFVVVSEKVNPVMQPKNIGDALQDCANSSLCRTMADGVATWIGVPPGTVSGAMAAVPVASRSGEEGRYSIKLPKGYEYCRSRIKMISVVPADGNRASVMSASAKKDGVDVYTWTPRRGLGEGRSWVEAEYTIIGVKGRMANTYRTSGKCKAYDRQLIGCRGNGSNSHGQPECRSVDD